MKSISLPTSLSKWCKTSWKCQLSSYHMYFHITKNMIENYNCCNKKAEGYAWDVV